MRLERPRLELGMKLNADEPRVIVVFDDLRQDVIWRHAGKAHATLLQTSLICRVDLVPVAVSLGNFGCAINLRDAATTGQNCIICAEPHCTAEITACGTPLQFISLQPFSHQA